MVGENIRILRKRMGISQGELGRRVGAHQNTVARWERGELVPRSDSLAKLSEALNVSLDALLNGDIDITVSERERQAKIRAAEQIRRGGVTSNVRFIRGPVVQVPVLGPESSVCCGKGFDLTDVESEVEWWEPIPEAWLTGPHGEKGYFVTHVEGDSMEPMIEDEERILINRDQDVSHGDVALVVWNDRSMVRGVKFERNGDVRLVPANKDYQEDIVKKDDAPYVLDFRGVIIRALGKDRSIRGIL